MKLNINRKEALAAVRKAAMAAMDNSPVLELTGILMVANEDTGQVAFSGTDLITAIRCELQADVEIGGSAVVNAQLLIGMPPSSRFRSHRRYNTPLHQPRLML